MRNAADLPDALAHAVEAVLEYTGDDDKPTVSWSFDDADGEIAGYVTATLWRGVGVFWLAAERRATSADVIARGQVWSAG